MTDEIIEFTVDLIRLPQLEVSLDLTIENDLLIERIHTDSIDLVRFVGLEVEL